MKKNFDENYLELSNPKRYKVYRKLFEGFRESRQKEGVDYNDPRFKNPDGTVNTEAVKRYAEELAEKELAEHAYVLSEFMSQKDTKYSIMIGVTAISRKYVSRADYTYSPASLYIKVTALEGSDESEAEGDIMLYDGYRLLVKNSDHIEDITLNVAFGAAGYPLRNLVGQPETITIQLYRHGKWEEELVQEITVSFVDIPYVPENQESEHLRIEFRGISDSFIAYGETKMIECRVYDGWDDITDEAVGWSIRRTTESATEDLAWGLKEKARNFKGRVPIVYSQFENDLGSGVKAEFEVTATLRSKEKVTAYLDF